MLQRIYRDEIRHVAAGTKWFGVATKRKGISPENHYQNLVNCHFRGTLKPPFNDSARRQAGLTREYRSEEHTSELQSLMRISYAVFCLKKTKKNKKKLMKHTKQ